MAEGFPEQGWPIPVEVKGVLAGYQFPSEGDAIAFVCDNRWTAPNGVTIAIEEPGLIVDRRGDIVYVNGPTTWTWDTL